MKHVQQHVGRVKPADLPPAGPRQCLIALVQFEIATCACRASIGAALGGVVWRVVPALRRWWLQIQGKRNGALDLFEMYGRKVAQFAFESDDWDRSDALYICKGLLFEETQLGKGHFVSTSSVLRGQGNIDNQCPWGRRIVTRKYYNRPGFRGQSEIRQPHFTVTVARQLCPVLPAQVRVGVRHRATRDRPVQLFPRFLRELGRQLPAATREVCCPTFVKVCP